MSRHLTLDEIRLRLVECLPAALPGPDAQRRFAPRPAMLGWSPDLTPDHARQAAVLVLVYPGRSGPTLPLTLRHTTLPAHAGQVSLPGGALDPHESPEDAALREAEEEAGIVPSSVRIAGRLSTLWVPVSNFVITPVVGISEAEPAFRVHEAEVAALIETPVARLLDPRAIGWGQRQVDGQPVAYPYFSVAGHAVWGATAMILSEFRCLFDPDAAPGAPPG